MKLQDKEIRDIIKYREAGKTLPNIECLMALSSSDTIIFSGVCHVF